jgi:hypothetical protein
LHRRRNALLGVEDVEAAMKRRLRPDAYNWAQRRLGIDVARFGDDRTVIFPRQGMAAFRPVEMRAARTTDIAARAALAHQRFGAELVFVDDTGHWGHGVIDDLTTAGYPVIRRAENGWLLVRDNQLANQVIEAGAHLPAQMVGDLRERQTTLHDYDPYAPPAEQRQQAMQAAGHALTDYDPYER